MTIKKFELEIDDGSGDCEATLWIGEEIIWRMPLGVLDIALKNFGKELFR